MELVEIDTKTLAEAMFKKLGLPKPNYLVHQLEQGEYRSQIHFHRTKERYLASAQQTKLLGPICEDSIAAQNHAADLTIEYMQNMEKKVLVDHNYYRLDQQKKAFARVSDVLSEKSKSVRQQAKTITKMTTDADNYMEKVSSASAIILGLTGVTSDPDASYSVHDLRYALSKIRDEVLALQETTQARRLSFAEPHPFDDVVSDPIYIGCSGVDSDEDYHQDMDDDYANYTRSP